MSDPRDSRQGWGVQVAEARERNEREPASVPALTRGRQESGMRPRPPARMPNGDPPSLMLWGTEEA